MRGGCQSGEAAWQPARAGSYRHGLLHRRLAGCNAWQPREGSAVGCLGGGEAPGAAQRGTLDSEGRAGGGAGRGGGAATGGACLAGKPAREATEQGRRAGVGYGRHLMQPMPDSALRQQGILLGRVPPPHLGGCITRWQAGQAQSYAACMPDHPICCAVPRLACVSARTCGGSLG